MLDGIDVSKYNGSIDWNAVKADGIDFAIVRVGYRGYDAGLINLDPYFHQHMQGAIDAGINVGAYFYTQAITVQEAVEEAKYCIKQVINRICSNFLVHSKKISFYIFFAINNLYFVKNTFALKHFTTLN